MTPAERAFLTGWTPEPLYCDRCYHNEKITRFVCHYCLAIERKYDSLDDEEYDFTKVIEPPF